MKRNIIVCLFFLLTNYSEVFSNSPVLKLQTFELLSGSYDERSDYWHSFSKRDREDLETFAGNYYQYAHLLREPGYGKRRIPKVLHFVWVGPNPFPEESIKNLLSWKKYHPHWVMKFWTDSKKRDCPIKGMEKHLIKEIPFLKLKPYLNKTTNYAEKADCLRYEILYSEGGIYVDHDVKCYRSFELLQSQFDFFVGLENPHVNEGTKTKVFPCNCLIGARPEHPILEEAILETERRWYTVQARYPGNERGDVFNRVINRTFHAFTLATKRCLNKQGNRDLVLPSSYFFAHTMFPRKTIKELKKKKLVFASHKFATTWLAVESGAK